MALARCMQYDNYEYREEVVLIGDDDIADAKAQFVSYHDRGVIKNDDYDDDLWTLDNQVKRYKIDLSISPDLYRVRMQHLLGCTYAQIRCALRVYLIYSLSYSLATVQYRMRNIVSFLRSGSVPNDTAKAFIVADFLDLLPGAITDLREKVSLRASYIIGDGASSQSRELVDYRSYLKFAHYLDLFWKDAADDERLLYFPVYLWWTLTSVLPLRVTEFALTPRQCVFKAHGEYRIRVRRTRLKTENGNAKHTIDTDYEITDHPIPESLAKEILAYIDKTNDEYHSDIDTLFSKQTQFRLLKVILPANHYTVSNLQQLLNRFYERVLVDRFGLTISTGEQITDNEIRKIKLGDTRHIAMINLMVSGNSIVTCKDLARHFDVFSADSYYINIKSFLDALHFENIVPNQPNILTPESNAAGMDIDVDHLTPVPDGFCSSDRYRMGDYSDCAAAVDAYGHIGQCAYCSRCLPTASALSSINNNATTELKKTSALVSYAIDACRSGDTPTMDTILQNLSAAASQYLHMSTLDQIVTREKTEVKRKAK